MKILLFTCFVGLLCVSVLAAANQNTSANKETGAVTWETSAGGVHFSLTQILAEQAQAFYINRGFSLNQIEPFTSSCVYMTVLRNDEAPGTIHFVRGHWSVKADGKSIKITTVDEWLKRLGQEGVKKSAMVAFRWAQFPPEQEYEPGGDWNQGMLAIELPPESRFDITARWDINGKRYETTLNEVQCAK